MPAELPRLDAEAFRRQAHRLVNWMADYLAHVGDLPVQPNRPPGSVRAEIPATPPEGPEPFERIMSDFERIIAPGLTHWGHPGFFGYFPANSSPPSVLAEMLTATIGAQCMSWNTSPAATELEQVMMEWLRGMVGLPDGFSGVIQDTASTATLVALITARDAMTQRREEDAKTRGRKDATADGGLDRLTAYTSEEANSSVTKGMRLAGFRREHIRLLETDADYAMRPDALEAAIGRDRAAGLVPAAVVATVGTTSSTAVDPVRPIAEISRREGAWLHVDAAFAGSAAILPEMRWILDGAEWADSVVFNPHKWLLVNFDCSAYFVRDRAALLRSFGASAEILKTAHDDRVVNYRDWGIQLGRRFRALKLWFVIRSYGVAGLQAMLREHIRLGRLFGSWVEAEPGFELMAPAPLATVCFRQVSASSEEEVGELDRRNERLLARLNATGRIFLTATRLRGGKGPYVLRLALGHLTTTEADVRGAWELIQEGARELGS
jgi:aromatic-L-amino-acid decarboxylase